MFFPSRQYYREITTSSLLKLLLAAFTAKCPGWGPTRSFLVSSLIFFRKTGHVTQCFWNVCGDTPTKPIFLRTHGDVRLLVEHARPPRSSLILFSVARQRMSLVSPNSGSLDRRSFLPNPNTYRKISALFPWSTGRASPPSLDFSQSAATFCPPFFDCPRRLPLPYSADSLPFGL